MKRVWLVLVLVSLAAAPAAAAETSVTVIDLEAKGVDATVADLATDDLATAIEAEGIPVVSNETLKAELKRRGISQTCGVDDCPVPFEKIVKSTHLLRGSLFETKENGRILKVTIETVSPRKPVFSGRREFDVSAPSTTAAVKDMARAVIDCLRGGSCKDNRSAQPASIASAVPAQATAPVLVPVSVPIPATNAGEMIAIPAGNFLYGSDKKSISLPAFRIDKTEVTVKAYGKCVEAGKCHVPDSDNDRYNWKQLGRDYHPVNGVNWDDAKSYCEWAGKRLPTEQEWEKAARGTDGRTYPWGEQEPTCDRVILNLTPEKDTLNQTLWGCAQGKTWPVCSKPDGNSPSGLCDMAGNVAEWTADWYDSSQKYRVLRGGSWVSTLMTLFRVSLRGNDSPEDRYFSQGFRCAQDAPTEKESALAAPSIATPVATVDPSPGTGVMIMIPAGNFLYGYEKKPVSLPAFRIDKTEVTKAAYMKCVHYGKCSTPATGQYCNWGKDDRNDHPMNCVDWNQSDIFCKWAGKRLPTEQEWEKAARGTDGRTYPWGEQEPTCDRTIMNQGGLGCGKNGTWPVCSKANGNSPYGLCDMAGNPQEWTADWKMVNVTRVTRGGSWFSVDAEIFRAADRHDDFPASHGSYYGFRCAMDVK